MLNRISRLFVIKTQTDACFIIYALALGAVLRGQTYLHSYPGFGGVLLFAACLAAVFMAGAKLLEATRATGEDEASDGLTGLRNCASGDGGSKPSIRRPGAQRPSSRLLLASGLWGNRGARVRAGKRDS